MYGVTVFHNYHKSIIYVSGFDVAFFFFNAVHLFCLFDTFKYVRIRIIGKGESNTLYRHGTETGLFCLGARRLCRQEKNVFLLQRVTGRKRFKTTTVIR